MILFLVCYLLLIYFFCYVYSIITQGFLQSCSLLLTNETGGFADSWTYNQQGVYSTIDTLVGHLIDFYNIQFYNQNKLDYSNAQELIVRSRFSSYTSICEINQFRYVSFDKIVVEKCACDSCVLTSVSLAICREEEKS